VIPALLEAADLAHGLTRHDPPGSQRRRDSAYLDTSLARLCEARVPIEAIASVLHLSHQAIRKRVERADLAGDGIDLVFSQTDTHATTRLILTEQPSSPGRFTVQLVILESEEEVALTEIIVGAALDQAQQVHQWLASASPRIPQSVLVDPAHLREVAGLDFTKVAAHA
jgi:ParB-like chromosome segregation protein Spo0J